MRMNLLCAKIPFETVAVDIVSIYSSEVTGNLLAFDFLRSQAVVHPKEQRTHLQCL
jgi:hypothetical protein